MLGGKLVLVTATLIGTVDPPVPEGVDVEEVEVAACARRPLIISNRAMQAQSQTKKMFGKGWASLRIGSWCLAHGMHALAKVTARSSTGCLTAKCSTKFALG